MPTQPLHVIEIIRRIPDCSTEPFLCRCDDGELYVVKGMPSVPRVQLIAEWISAHIAKSLGLPLLKLY
ncbi:HipA family kinase [Cronobacter turicensis]|uniref:HipA family kinase n=1 Tax=Cronobacter sakazakii TaxID=28141 RepID=UPI000E933A02